MPIRIEPPYTPERYLTISQAWNAPVPEAGKITCELGGVIIAVAMCVTPALIMHYGCGMDVLRGELNKCFRKPAQFFLPPVLVGMLVGATLVKARDLSYRVSHIIQTSAYQGYNLIKRA